MQMSRQVSRGSLAIIKQMSRQVSRALLAIIRQMSRQVSRALADEYQAHEQAAVAWFSWGVSSR